jgi:glycosyltransferase involved in cell wall biosynthesis
MKILQVTNFYKPIWEAGGPARSTYEMSRHLIARGHDVTVYTTNWAYQDYHLTTNTPVDVEGVRVYYFENLRKYAPHLLPPTPYYSPVVARKEVGSYDIVHMNEYRALLTAGVCRYARRYRVPYVLQARGSLPKIMHGQRLKGFFDRVWGSRMLHGAARVIALNPREVEQYGMMGVAPERIVTIPNGVDLTLFRDLPKPGTFREAFDIPEDEQIILFLGRIHRIKGTDLLVDAFAEVLQRGYRARLVIVGPDAGLLPALKQQISALGIGERILFTGPLYEARDKLSAYIDADVYVLPSVYETFPNSVLEANACGTAAILTDRCGIAEMIDGKGGVVVRYDRDDLRDAIIELLDDDAMRRRFGTDGKKMVFSEFGWETIVERVEGLYREVVEEQSL